MVAVRATAALKLFLQSRDERSVCFAVIMDRRQNTLLKETTMKKSVAFLMFFLLGPVCSFADETATIDESQSKDEKQRWSASNDLSALKGNWKVTENNECAIDPNDNVSLVRFLLIKGEVLHIDDKDFCIEQTYLKGKVSNDMNKIDFVPERWLNTLEPKLRFSFVDGSKVEVSYVVNDEYLHLRYPANSCSRSGVRIILKREKQ